MLYIRHVLDSIYKHNMIIPIACLLAYVIFNIYKNIIKKPETLEGKHVFITGGSSGIGKALAILAAKQGAHVTIIARDSTKLNLAVNEIRNVTISDSQKITCITLDVTNYEDVETCMRKVDDERPIYMLINCVGMSICGKIEDMSIEEIRTMIDINFYGTYFPIKAIVGKMKERKYGSIVITGSQASLLGIFGFTSYSASKYALRGLAEALDMEVRAYNINVTVALPPDTDTPGFERENQTKLEETKLICESGGLFRPEDVAKRILKDALGGKFLSYIGFESFILTTLCVGMTRHSSLFELLEQFLLLGPFRLISTFYLSSFYKIIKRVSDRRSAEKKSK